MGSVTSVGAGVDDGPVLVVGASGSGADVIAAALRRRLPQRVIIRSRRDGHPGVVVFALSAAAAPAASDWDLLAAAATGVPIVVGVVTKTDLHPRWPSVLADARRGVGEHVRRGCITAWMTLAGVASADAEGADAGLDGLCDLIAEVSRDAAGVNAGSTAAARGPGGAPHAAAARIGVNHTRVRLRGAVRKRCAEIRADLRREAGLLSREEFPAFSGRSRQRITREFAEIEAAVTAEFAAVIAATLPGRRPELRHGSSGPSPTIPIPAPPPARQDPEARLTALVAGGFGVGVTASLGRAVGYLTAGIPALTPVLSIACVVLGSAAAIWVVRARGLLERRTRSGRWAVEAVAALQSEAEQVISLRALVAESAIVGGIAESGGI